MTFVVWQRTVTKVVLKKFGGEIGTGKQTDSPQPQFYRQNARNNMPRRNKTKICTACFSTQNFLLVYGADSKNVLRGLKSSVEEPTTTPNFGVHQPENSLCGDPPMCGGGPLLPISAPPILGLGVDVRRKKILKILQ
jgi:hypothetical protein